MNSTEASGTVDQQVTLECSMGIVTYLPHEIIHFDDGLFGYEEEREYVIYEDSQYYPFHWMISINNPELMFPVVNPRDVLPDYEPEIQDMDAWDFIVNVVSLGKTLEDITVNLRAPILMKKNPRKGKQTILTDSDFSLRHQLFQQSS